MGNKKDFITNETARRYSDFKKNSIYYEDIIDVISRSKEPVDLHGAVALLEKCMTAYFDLLEKKLNEEDFTIIHDAALRLISANDETYTHRTYVEMFKPIQVALNDGKENGYLNFRDAEATRLLNVLSDDYRLILCKLFLLEPYVKKERYHEFADLLARYTALIFLDASQCAAFYNSNEYKELTHKLLSVERGETSQSDDVKEKREALIEEITMEAISLIDADDSISIEERAKKIPSIVDDLVEKINMRTEDEINIALEEEFPLWRDDKIITRERNRKRENQIADLKIASRRARKVVRDEWGKRHASSVEN